MKFEDANETIWLTKKVKKKVNTQNLFLFAIESNAKERWNGEKSKRVKRTKNKFQMK